MTMVQRPIETTADFTTPRDEVEGRRERPHLAAAGRVVAVMSHRRPAGAWRGSTDTAPTFRHASRFITCPPRGCASARSFCVRSARAATAQDDRPPLTASSTAARRRIYDEALGSVAERLAWCCRRRPMRAGAYWSAAVTAA